ncbi:MAG: alpha/beta hydrolase [Chloroflexi bacterium]|nr:alpha/beta hydrolase [Chloroflexota bacterium]
MSEPVVEFREIAGLKTAYCVLGAGQPVLTLHGWGASLRNFWPVAEDLAPNGYAVHLLDLPGFGETALPPEPWRVSDYVRFVFAYLDDAGLDRVALLGHSFGGRIALVLAADAPERVSKMVLANSAGLRAPLSLRQQIRNRAARSVRSILQALGQERLRNRLQARYNRRFASEDYLTAGPLRETFVRVIEEDLSPYAERVQAPTVLIWGDQDADTPLWQGQKLEQLIPDAGLIVFEGAGHYSYTDRLPDYIRIVDHFLKDGS